MQCQGESLYSTTVTGASWEHQGLSFTRFTPPMRTVSLRQKDRERSITKSSDAHAQRRLLKIKKWRKDTTAAHVTNKG